MDNLNFYPLDKVFKGVSIKDNHFMKCVHCPSAAHLMYVGLTFNEYDVFVGLGV